MADEAEPRARADGQQQLGELVPRPAAAEERALHRVGRADHVELERLVRRQPHAVLLERRPRGERARERAGQRLQQQPVAVAAGIPAARREIVAPSAIARPRAVRSQRLGQRERSLAALGVVPTHAPQLLGLWQLARRPEQRVDFGRGRRGTGGGGAGARAEAERGARRARRPRRAERRGPHRARARVRGGPGVSVKRTGSALVSRHMSSKWGSAPCNDDAEGNQAPQYFNFSWHLLNSVPYRMLSPMPHARTAARAQGQRPFSAACRPSPCRIGSSRSALRGSPRRSARLDRHCVPSPLRPSPPSCPASRSTSARSHRAGRSQSSGGERPILQNRRGTCSGCSCRGTWP